MRQARLFLLLTSAILCGGCFQFSTVLSVKGDGLVATIDQRMIFTQAPSPSCGQFAALGRREELSRAHQPNRRRGEAAATMGTGVTYVSSTPISSSEGVGRDIRYAFSDISQLRLDETPPAPGWHFPGSGRRKRPASHSRWRRQANGQATLTVFVPQLPMMPGSNASRAGNMPSMDQMSAAEANARRRAHVPSSSSPRVPL